MQIICEKEKLLKALLKCQGITSTKLSLSILSNIYLKAKDNHLHLFTTNLEIGLECKIKVNLLKEGEVVISSKKLFDIVKESPTNEILISKDEKEVVISCEKTTYKLNYVSEEEFPRFPEINKEKSFSIPSFILKEMIKKVIFASSLDTFRYVLNSIYLSISGSNIEMVATDGYRLATINKKLDNKKFDFNSLDLAVIIPNKTLQELSKITNDDEEKIDFFIEENQISFKGDDFVLNSKLIEGNYPNYKELIPHENKNKFHINRRVFLNTCKRVSIISNNQLFFTLSSDSLAISSYTPEIGSCNEEVKVKYQGDDLKISFNAKYLIDVLKNIEEEEICFSFEDEKRAGLISYDESYKYVILPMRIKVD
ncbi:DNA polymerase III subunit beta [bacterium]|nr:DNA polymerase III subunit beta [bacterium]